jgi:hypothetical protein
MTWIGELLVNSVRRMRDPVTTNSSVSASGAASAVDAAFSAASTGAGVAVWANAAADIDAAVKPAIPKIIVDLKSLARIDIKVPRLIFSKNY